MMPPDPLANEGGERAKLPLIGCGALVWSACQQPPCAFREPVPSIAAVEEGEPGRARQRRNRLARKRCKRCATHQHRKLGELPAAGSARIEPPADPVEF